MYRIKSYQGVNDIKFGFDRFQIEEYMKIKPIKFRKSPYDKSETDMYEDLFVYYDDDGKCEAIEFNSNAELVFGKISFFDKSYADIEKEFRNIDADIEIDDVGFNSIKYGIGIYAPNKEDSDSKIESVIIFKQGYYD